MNRDGGDDNNLGGGGDGFAPAGQQQQGQGGGGDNQDDNNPQVEDDHDDDDEEEDEDGMDRDENRVLDGGVAGNANSSNANDDSSTAAPRRRAADCDLILYITCAENMDDLVPNHPVLKEGVVVSIGLDKNTKLGAVFSRYTEFCNENSTSNSITNQVEESDLEFFHCQLLNGNDTAESSALMKNDRIKVRRERAAERETQAELRRIQRESDREYFKLLGHLMPDYSGDRNDLIIDCQGKQSDGIGRNQQVLATKVRAHSTILAKRCKWLGSLIQKAREERKIKHKKNLVTTDVAMEDEEGKEIQPASPQSDNCIEEEFVPKGNIVANTSSTLPEDNEGRPRREDRMEEDDDDDDDDGIAVLPLPGPHDNNRPQPQEPLQRGGAAEIENDDDNENGLSDVESVAPAPTSSSSSNRRISADATKSAKDAALEAQDADKLWITVNHTPEAVKILMEYCYTNRVISLGHDAFVQACRTKPVKPNGPVAPYSSARRWKNNGAPEVSFTAALDGISLAEEAGMPRLSLMCEVAAAQLVGDQNCVEALSKCTSQKELTGNDLPRLREVAINVVLKYGPRSVYDTARFREALEGRTSSILPALFSGTVEAIANTNDKHKSDSRKRSRPDITERYFEDLDREDQNRRDNERRKRRLERYGKNPKLAAEHIVNNDDERDVYLENVTSQSWATETARRSLKRMSQHLNVGGFNLGRSGGGGGGGYASRVEALNGRVGGYGVVRRRTSRRRSSERS